MLIRCCATCAYWRAGAAPSMAVPARDDSHDDMGACENIVPKVVVINEGPTTVQPTTHATRCCADWSSQWVDLGMDPDDPDDPDDGEPHPRPAPDPTSRVRNLFPIRPAPIAA